MEQIERALRKSKEQRRTTARLRNGAVARIKSSPADDEVQTRCVSLTPTLLRAHRIVTTAVQHPATDAYRSLGPKVLQALNSRAKTTIGITSSGHGEGKTLTAVNLAIAMAM